MSLEFLSDITIKGEYESMTVEVGVWDNGVGALIDPALSPMANCTLSLIGGYGQVMLDGDIYADIVGKHFCSFMLKFWSSFLVFLNLLRTIEEKYI